MYIYLVQLPPDEKSKLENWRTEGGRYTGRFVLVVFELMKTRVNGNGASVKDVNEFLDGLSKQQD